MALLHREKHRDDVVTDDESRVHEFGGRATRPEPATEYDTGERVVPPPMATTTATVPATPMAERTDRGAVAKVREREWAFAPGQVVSLAAGIAFAIVGTIVMIRAGIDGSLEEPVVQVLRWDHTAWLGMAEVGFGLLLILAGAGVRGRPLSIVLGVLAVVAGVVILAEWESLPSEFAIEREFGWPLAITGGVVALAALVLPVWRSQTVNRDEIDLRDRERVTQT